MALTNSISKRTVVIDATPIPNDGIIEVTQTQTIEAPIVTQTWGKPEHTVAAKNDKKFTISATASSKACAMLLKILKEQEINPVHHDISIYDGTILRTSYKNCLIEDAGTTTLSTDASIVYQFSFTALEVTTTVG